LALARLRKKAYEKVESSSRNTPPSEIPRSIASEELLGVSILVSNPSVTTEVTDTIALLEEIVKKVGI